KRSCMLNAVLAGCMGIICTGWTQNTQKPEANADKRAVEPPYTRFGTISQDGRTFTDDADNRKWNITNPNALKGHEGQRVRVEAMPLCRETHIAASSAFTWR